MSQYYVVVPYPHDAGPTLTVPGSSAEQAARLYLRRDGVELDPSRAYKLEVFATEAGTRLKIKLEPHVVTEWRLS